jgi:hypothetical protein
VVRRASIQGRIGVVERLTAAEKLTGAAVTDGDSLARCTSVAPGAPRASMTSTATSHQ